MRATYEIVADVLADRQISANEAYGVIRLLARLDRAQTVAIHSFCNLIFTEQDLPTRLECARAGRWLLDELAQSRKSDPLNWLVAPIDKPQEKQEVSL